MAETEKEPEFTTRGDAAGNKSDQHVLLHASQSVGNNDNAQAQASSLPSTCALGTARR